MKYLILLYVAFFSLDSTACKRGPQDATFHSPQLAKTILLLESVKKDKENRIMTLITKSPWKKSILKAVYGPCVGLVSDEGETSLFLTTQPLQSLEGKVLHYGDGVSVKLGNLERMNSLLPWLVENENLSEISPNIFWGYCQNNQDCTQTKDSCREHVGVNKKYKANYDSYIEKNKFPLKCTNRKKDTGVSKCIENFCS